MTTSERGGRFVPFAAAGCTVALARSMNASLSPGASGVCSTSNSPAVSCGARGQDQELAWLVLQGMTVQHRGIAKRASNGWPLLSTPKQITSSLRMAAIRICLGLSRPWARSLAANAATALLCRIATMAGM